MKWEYKYKTPNFGKLYHKGNNIMIIYSKVIKIFIGCSPMLPVYCKYKLEREIK